MLVLQGVTRAVESLAFHPNGGHLVTAGGYSRQVEYWSVPARAKLREWVGPYEGKQVRFHPSGRWFVCGHSSVSPGADDDFITVDTSTWALVPLKAPASPTYIALAPAGDRLVVLDDQYDERLVCYGTSAAGVGREEWATLLDAPARVRGWDVRGLDFFPTGDRFASVENRSDGEGHTVVVRTRSAADGRIVGEVECPCAMGFDVRVSPDGAWVALHSLRALHLIPPGDPAAQVQIRNPNRKQITALAFHPSGRYLAVTSNDRTVRFHDREAGWAVSRTYDWNIGKLKSVAFSADGALAAAGGEKGSVVVWDVEV